jgi:hypothetical protein
MARSPAQAETAQDSDRKESKARSRDLASISAPMRRGSDQAAPPCARVDGLEPPLRASPPAAERQAIFLEATEPRAARPKESLPRGIASRASPVGGVNGR